MAGPKIPSSTQSPDQHDVNVGANSNQEYIFLKVGHSIQRIAIPDILIIVGMKDYLRVHTVSEKGMTLNNFARLEELLRSHNFARVH